MGLQTSYRNVYFRINLKSYYNDRGVGFTTEEQRKEFFDSAVSLFVGDGWIIKEQKYVSSGSCPTVTKGNQSLYLHPQSFSGVVSLDNIQGIEQLLSTAVDFKYYKTDIYNEIFDLTDEQYTEYLKSKQEEITADILELYTTKRRNLYITTDVCFRIAQKYQLKRIQASIYTFCSGNIECRFIEAIFSKLLEEHKIVSASTKHGTGYRTATAKDVA